MSLVIPNGFAYHVLTFSQPGVPDPMTVTFGTAWDSATDTLEAVAEAVASNWSMTFLTMQDTSLTFDQIHSTGRNATGTLMEHEEAINLPGTANYANILPPNNALLVKKRTGVAGRTNRGRMYVMAALTELSTDDNGNIVPATLVDYQTQADDFLQSLALAPVVTPMYVLHNITPNIPVPGPPTLVTSLVVDGLIATQRRRLR